MLEDIQKYISELIALYESERSRADDLSLRLSDANEDIRTLREQIVELNRQIDNMSLSQAFMAGGDNTMARERIDRLIKDIDKCIRQLEA